MSDDILFRNRYRIPSARLASWDYRWAGIYSVTICTQERTRWLSEVRESKVILSPIGQAVAEEWKKIPRGHPRVRLDEWIIMPDHIHGILIFQGNQQSQKEQDPEERSRLFSQSLGAVLGQFKSNSTKRIRMDLKQKHFAWQPRFHDTILRDEQDLDRVRAYIRGNPARWERK